MIEELIRASHGGLLVPVVIGAVGVFGVKGLFSVHLSYRQARKDFLDVWPGDDFDDLWTEVAVRHVFGVFLPAALIRSLRSSPQAARALSEVSDSWPLLDMDDETGDVQWRHRWLANPAQRRTLRVALGVGYFVTMWVGLAMAYVLVAHPSVLSPVWWALAVAFVSVALWFLRWEDVIAAAHRAVPRWLGLQ